MLLKLKSLLIARKLLMYFFGPKTINNLLHRKFFWMVYKYDFFTKPKSWCMAKCLTEVWWWYPETGEIVVLCSKQAQKQWDNWQRG